ncbi:hypothetical protein C7377_0170 [Balneicella halophila]|uniref:Uncharacterized protein n=1 Tax=Balneicella halophila TaxID=1537566 RepID=A0A7L4UQC9_BALHA|nr:hypothetical protein C7377_0170 [Balneicella halophila]
MVSIVMKLNFGDFSQFLLCRIISLKNYYFSCVTTKIVYVCSGYPIIDF